MFVLLTVLLLVSVARGFRAAPNMGRLRAHSPAIAMQQKKGSGNADAQAPTAAESAAKNPTVVTSDKFKGMKIGDRPTKKNLRRKIMGSASYKRGGTPFDLAIHQDVSAKMSELFAGEPLAPRPAPHASGPSPRSAPRPAPRPTRSRMSRVRVPRLASWVRSPSLASPGPTPVFGFCATRRALRTSERWLDGGLQPNPTPNLTLPRRARGADEGISLPRARGGRGRDRDHIRPRQAVR